ncbi:MAG: hypothetical protein U5L00_07335 [Desulfovermiculus sp.]|nr:hypothetical protein [Desulfovermiculus sp.]
MSAFYECEIAKAKKRFNQSFGRIPTVNPSLRFAAIMVVIRMMKFTNEMHPENSKEFFRYKKWLDEQCQRIEDYHRGGHLNFITCPDCGTKLWMNGRCRYCPVCGWSTCC